MTRAERQAEYRRLLHAAAPVQRCAMCSKRSAKSDMHPHHPNGRGAHLLEFIWLCPACHGWVHDNPAKAKELKLYHP